jgi:2-polyprenyl-3-methyl-5-hydroxy-6-metoxy-1,4-benzoquinol methylase
MMAAAGLACWCLEGTWNVCFRRKTFGLLRCSGCGCYRIDPPAVAAPSGLGNFYTTYYNGRSQAVTAVPVVRASRFWKVAGRVPALDEPGACALDIGCGEGSLCAELKAAGWHSVAGIDISRSRIARARELRPDIDFYDVPLERTGIAPGTIDLAIMDNVIEHVPDPQAQIERIRPFLHAGSRLVLITPNMESGHFRLLGSRWTPELAPHVHIFLFTKESLTEMARRAGFSIEACGAFHLDPYPVRELAGRVFKGDIKGAIWKAYQETGSLYARCIGAGPMLFVVARPRRASGNVH